ncbi:hypothetical protein COV19_07745 [Candidatus Woesearchaeota archaeon CG10_big_fil_rev_8_21_14_0_10_44_13]|nr:MAG: hypothetical protein COV19_07745 [Candidatus Woesearchaeota archaeon CG10_big_fil_rev_8_21_14_0_10_44_13]
MKRRHFIDTAVKIAGLGAAAASGLLSIGWTPDDFVVVDKDENAGSLEPCLLNGKDNIPSVSELKASMPELKGSIPFAARHPSLVYLINANPGSPCDYSPFSVGLATILNKEGFVLTSYHVVEEAIKENKLPLLYDPSTSMIRRLNVLAYSTKERFDLALGKVELPKAYADTMPLSITRGNITKDNVVYAVVPDNNMLTSKDIVAEVLHSIKIYGCGSERFIVEQTDVPHERDWGWRPVVSKASYVERPGDHDPFFEAPSDLTPGCSGIAFLSARHNDITGLLMKQGGLCTGPESIRRFIVDYIYKSTGKWVPLQAEASGRSE